VHPDLKAVIDLQVIDLRIAELNSQVGQAPSKLQALDAQLKRSSQVLDERKQRLTANQKERRDLEGDIQPIRAKISKHKDQLYEVKTNEQYRAMLKEIEGEEGNIRKIEDRVLEKMVEAEELQKQIEHAAADLENERKRLGAEKAVIESGRDAALGELDRLNAQRNDLANKLSETVRNLYQRIAGVRRGVAVAEVRDGCCSACNVRLRPQAYNEVRTNEEVLTCENCGRILYYIEPQVTTESQPGQNHARAGI